MKTVKEILQEKGSETKTIRQEQTVQEALAVLAEANIGALIVLDDLGNMSGILSERDYVRKVLLKGTCMLDMPVKEIMTDEIIHVHPQMSVDACMALVTEKRCRHLPVLENGELLGIVSIGDLVKASMAEKEFLITQLTKYIGSG